MNNTAKQREKAVRACIAKRYSQGWTTEQIAKRVWFCFGYLTGWAEDAVMVKMHAGVVTFPREPGQ